MTNKPPPPPPPPTELTVDDVHHLLQELLPKRIAMIAELVLLVVYLLPQLLL